MYVPLLLRMANDVEENSVPTISFYWCARNCLSFWSNVLFVIQWSICRLFVYGNQQPTLLFFGNALDNLFLDSQLNYQHWQLIATLLQFLRLLKGYFLLSFKRFIWHTIPIWKMCAISVENINNLIYFTNTVPRGNVTRFEVKGLERGNCSFNKFWHKPKQACLLCQSNVKSNVSRTSRFCDVTFVCRYVCMWDETCPAGIYLKYGSLKRHLRNFEGP